MINTGKKAFLWEGLFSCFRKPFSCLAVNISEVVIMKKAVLTFICSLILMGGFGAAALPEKAEPAFTQSSYSTQSNYSTLSDYDPGSMPKIIYVV